MSTFRINSELLYPGELPVYDFNDWNYPVFYLDEKNNVLRKDPPVRRIHLPECEHTGVSRTGCLLGVLSAAQALCLAAETLEPMCVHILVRTDFILNPNDGGLHIFQFAMMAGVDWDSKNPVKSFRGFPTAARLDADLKQLRDTLIVGEVMGA